MTLIVGSSSGQVGVRQALTRSAALAGTSAGACCRLELASATQLELIPFRGTTLIIGASAERLSAAVTCDNTDNLIAADGSDAGAAPAVNTTYHAYYGAARLAAMPSELRLSATAPTLVDGVYLLGSTGEAAGWLYVGVVRTVSNGGTAEFRDSLTQRLVASYYNRRQVGLFTCPGYADDNVGTSFNMNNAVHAALNAGTGASVEWVSFGEDAVALWADFALVSVGGADTFCGLEVAAAIAGTNPLVGARTNSGGSDMALGLAYTDTVAGYRTATLTACTDGVNTVFAADHPRRGATADLPATILVGALWT